MEVEGLRGELGRLREEMREEVREEVREVRDEIKGLIGMYGLCLRYICFFLIVGRDGKGYREHPTHNPFQ